VRSDERDGAAGNTDCAGEDALEEAHTNGLLERGARPKNNAGHRTAEQGYYEDKVTSVVVCNCCLRCVRLFGPTEIHI
jgi:hypothetical protein